MLHVPVSSPSLYPQSLNAYGNNNLAFGTVEKCLRNDSVHLEFPAIPLTAGLPAFEAYNILN
jgi:hypothetical protein